MQQQQPVTTSTVVLAPNYAPYDAIAAAASILEGVNTVLVHPRQLDDAKHIAVVLAPYSDMPIRIVLVGKCWTPKCIDVVNSWASQSSGCVLDSTTCVTDRPAEALSELLVELAPTQYERKNRLRLNKQNATVFGYIDDQLNNKYKGSFFAGMLNWRVADQPDRSSFSKFTEFFEGLTEGFTRKAVETKGEAIIEAIDHATLTYIKQHAIVVDFVFNGVTLKCVLFNYTLFARELHAAIRRWFEENYDLSIAFTYELKLGRFRCSLDSHGKGDLARRVAEFFGGGGNDTSAGFSVLLGADHKLPYPLNNIVLPTPTQAA